MRIFESFPYLKLSFYLFVCWEKVLSVGRKLIHTLLHIIQKKLNSNNNNNYITLKEIGKKCNNLINQYESFLPLPSFFLLLVFCCSSFFSCSFSSSFSSFSSSSSSSSELNNFLKASSSSTPFNSLLVFSSSSSGSDLIQRKILPYLTALYLQ